MVSNPSILGPSDLNLIGSYSNGGYAPLSARLIEASTRANGGWQNITNELRELKGKCYISKTMIINNDNDSKKQDDDTNDEQKYIIQMMRDEKKVLQKNNKQKEETRKQKAQQKSDAMSTHKTILVFFVGGVTYAEISAIRMLEQRPNTPWKFIIASTNIARGN
eukprot:752291_1